MTWSASSSVSTRSPVGTAWSSDVEVAVLVDLLDLGDHHRVVVHAAVGERAVAHGHVERRHVAGAEHERVHGRELRGDAQPLGQVDDVLRTDLEHQLRVGGVRRHAGGVDEVEHALLGAAVVAHLPVLARLGAGHAGERHRPGALNFELSEMPWWMASASTNGLNAEPARGRSRPVGPTPSCRAPGSARRPRSRGRRPWPSPGRTRRRPPGPPRGRPRSVERGR